MPDVRNRVINTFRSYHDDSVWEIERWETNYKQLSDRHKCARSKQPFSPHALVQHAGAANPGGSRPCYRVPRLDPRPFRAGGRAFFPELPAVHLSARRAVAGNAEFIAALLSTYEARGACFACK